MIDIVGGEAVGNEAGEVGRVMCFLLVGVDFKARGAPAYNNFRHGTELIKFI